MNLEAGVLISLNRGSKEGRLWGGSEKIPGEGDFNGLVLLIYSSIEFSETLKLFIL